MVHKPPNSNLGYLNHYRAQIGFFDSVFHWLYMYTRKVNDILTFSRFLPPEIPDGFDAQHKFPTPVQSAEKFSDSAPVEVPPPEDTSLTLLIDGCAAMVARCGKHIEDFYKEKSKTNPQFMFLSGGDGCKYYMRKLWEHQQKYVGQQRPDSAKSKTSSENLTAENRGRILGERPLDRSTKLHSPSLSVKEAVQLQSNLVDTFVKPISLVSFVLH